MTEERFLIIGAGPVGLAVAKSLNAASIAYDQVEADNDVGGNWYHGTYESTHILSSKYVTQYPDFHMPDEYPDFPSRAQMHTYYQEYASKFNLLRSIKFGAKVVSVNSVYKNLWNVILADGTSNIYKGVIVCNGHHWSKRYPKLEGVFNGETFHSKEYKSVAQIKGKRVLVIGAGNSAFDMASECARESLKCFLSFRRGIWIFPKTLV